MGDSTDLFRLGERMTQREFRARSPRRDPFEPGATVSRIGRSLFLNRQDATRRHWLAATPHGDAARLVDDLFVRVPGHPWRRADEDDRDARIVRLSVDARLLTQEFELATAPHPPTLATEDGPSTNPLDSLPTTVTDVIERGGRRAFVIVSDGVVEGLGHRSEFIVSAEGHHWEETTWLDGAQTPDLHIVHVEVGVPQDAAVRAAVASAAPVTMPAI